MSKQTWAMRCVVAALCVCAAAAAPAATRGRTEAGVPFVSGGVGQGEVQRLRNERSQYSLSVLTVARPSGAYLADVHVRIRDRAGRTVFNQALDGPWLMVDLPRGRYEVDARYAGHAQHQSTSIAGRGNRELVFRFPVQADVLAGRSRR